MHNLEFEEKRAINWSNASDDYAAFRPGPPPSFFQKLCQRGVGLPGQHILDLGTGTGHLARNFATQGAIVAGIDASAGQIEQAQKCGLNIDFRQASAEAIPFQDGSYDIITANQCWIYFDIEKTMPEVRRILRPEGMLVTSHFSYVACEDPIAQMSEELIKKYNPSWDWGEWDGTVPEMPAWSLGQCTLKDMFVYDEQILFTEASWRGRMRAHRAIGAELSKEEVEAFDAELGAILKSDFAEQFFVLHRLDAHFFVME